MAGCPVADKSFKLGRQPGVRRGVSRGSSQPAFIETFAHISADMETMYAGDQNEDNNTWLVDDSYRRSL